MRIIRGKYKHRRIPTPTRFKARPTTDFAKEGLFNILENNYIDFEEDQPTVLDLFAGTGSIGLEFASRGCRQVTSVEKDFHHWQYLRELKQALEASEWKPIHTDVFKFLKQTQEQYDIVFADPPYDLPNLADLPDWVLGSDNCQSHLTSNGLFILEHGRNYDFSGHACYIDHRNYGSVNFTFFRRSQHNDPH